MPTESTGLYDKTFQEKLAANLIRCPRLLNLLGSGKVLQTDFDFPVIRAVIQSAIAIVKLWEHATTPIPQSVMMDQLMMMKRAGGILDHEIPALCELVHKIYQLEPAPDYYYPQISSFLGHQRIREKMRTVSPHRPDEFAEVMSRVAASAKIERRATIMPLKHFKRTVAAVPVPTGLGNIDTAMSGGLGKKEYGIMCAYTGVGKTTLALNMAWGAAKQGFKVCFATLELDEDKIRERLYSLVARYSYDRIRGGDPTGGMTKEEIWDEVEQRYTEAAAQFTPNGRSIEENFHIWDFSTDTCSIGTLEDCLLEEIQRDPAHPPDLLVVDWLLCLDERPGFDPRQMGDKEMRHKLQRYSDELSKKIARRFNIAVWATHQADAKAEGKDKITMAHAAEGKSVGWKCSVFIGVGASEENRKSNPPIFTVNAAKMRDGRLFTARLVGHLHEQRFEPFDENDYAAAQAPIQNNDLEASRQRQAGMMLPPRPAPAPA